MYYTNLDVREHNAQNEISRHQVRVSGSFVDVKPEVNLSADSYDIEGNLRETAADNAQHMDHQFAVVYDAWNRLVKVRKGTAPPLVQYARDGLGRIVVNQASHEHWYYDGWRLVSVFDDDLADDGLVKEYVWGVRYIDEIGSTVSYSGSAVRRYHLQDANWNVVLTLDSGAADQEAIMYDPYGKPEFWIKSGSYFRYGDLTSPCGTDVLFQGRSYACLSANLPGGTRYLRLYDFRHRAYAPALGRFLQRDPIGGWGDRMARGNSYCFVDCVPLVYNDPAGLKGCTPRPKPVENPAIDMMICMEATRDLLDPSRPAGGWAHHWIEGPDDVVPGGAIGFWPTSDVNGPWDEVGGIVAEGDERATEARQNDWKDVKCYKLEVDCSKTSSRTMQAGTGKDKNCCCITTKDLKDCIRKVIEEWNALKYCAGLGRNCWVFPEDVRNKCCLKYDVTKPIPKDKLPKEELPKKTE